MYSPKIPERLIPPLYWLARAQGRPMTLVVAEAVERFLASEGLQPTVQPDEHHPAAHARPGGARRGA